MFFSSNLALTYSFVPHLEKKKRSKTTMLRNTLLKRLALSMPMLCKAVDIEAVVSKGFALRTAHKQLLATPSASAELDKLEADAWVVLNSVAPSSCQHLSLSDTTALLSVLRYFSKSWTNGIRGPSDEIIRLASPVSQLLQVEEGKELRRTSRVMSTTHTTPLNDAPRRSPLDDVLE